MPPAFKAAVAVAGAVLVAGGVGGSGWQTPRQLLEPPYVADVPGELAALLVVTALAGLAAVGVLSWRFRLQYVSWMRAVLMAAVLLTSTAASGWNALYSAAVENPIPVMEWLFFAVPAALAGVILGRAQRPGLRAVPGLLTLIPAGALSAVGWSVEVSRPVAGWTVTGFSLALGIAVGLWPPLVGFPGPQPPSTAEMR